MHQWLGRYLHEKKQRVVIQGKQSSLKTLHSGPLLFLVYINDLTDAVNGNLRLHADDSTLYFSHTNKEQAAIESNRDLSKVSDWAKQWFVEFNPNKTESMVFARRNTQHIPPIYMQGTQIKDVQSHKHLGVTLYVNAKWHSHIKGITSKAMEQIDVMRSLMYRLDRKTLHTMYITFVRPILEYASIVWCNCTDEQKQHLENVQG